MQQNNNLNIALQNIMNAKKQGQNPQLPLKQPWALRNSI